MFTDSNCCPWLKSSNIWCEKYRVYCEVSSPHWLCSESLKGLQWCLEVGSSVQHPSWWNWISEVKDLKCSFISTKEPFEDFNRKSLEGCSKNQRITSIAVWADNRKAHLDNETQVQYLWYIRYIYIYHGYIALAYMLANMQNESQVLKVPPWFQKSGTLYKTEPLW